MKGVIYMANLQIRVDDTLKAEAYLRDIQV